ISFVYRLHYLLHRYAAPLAFFFFLSRPASHLSLPSFPTRRSSDLCASTAGVCTFGSPLVGNQSFAGSFNTKLPDRSLRYVNDHRSEEPRLNSSHLGISYAVFCLKKKKKTQYTNKSTTPSPTKSSQL